MKCNKYTPNSKAALPENLILVCNELNISLSNVISKLTI